MTTPFRSEYYTLYKMLFNFPVIINATQSLNNITILKDKLKLNNIIHLPININRTYITRQTPNTSNRNGIIFIGRYDKRKNPEAFAKLIFDLKDKYSIILKAKVLTRYTHYSKWEKLFKKYNITDYEINDFTKEEEKMDYIQSSRLAFHPSYQESFGIAALETLSSCPTFLLEEYNWYKNFDGFVNLRVANKKNLVDLVYAELQTPFNYINESTKYIHDCENIWITKLAEFETYYKNRKQSSNENKYIKYLKKTKSEISINKLYKEIANKNILYYTSDIEPFYKYDNFEFEQYNNFTNIKEK